MVVFKEIQLALIILPKDLRNYGNREIMRGKNYVLNWHIEVKV